jgi:hypothetical protein
MHSLGLTALVEYFLRGESLPDQPVQRVAGWKRFARHYLVNLSFGQSPCGER